MDLKNKVIAITGGTGGLALSTAGILLNGYDVKYVALLELDLPECRKIFENLEKAYGERIGFYPCDVTKSLSIAENFDRIIKNYGTIDILINNAGVIGDCIAEQVIDTNVKGLIMASHLLIDRIGKQKYGNGGLIVNIASTAAYNVFPCSPVYSASKSAVVSFTRTMKHFSETSGVKMVALCPGPTSTKMMEKILNDDVDWWKMDDKIMAAHPLQSPENVAKAIVSIIKYGESGDVWICENDEPPYSVKHVDDYKSLRLKYYPQ